MLFTPSDIKVEVTIIRADGTKDLLGTVSLFNQGKQDDHSINEPSQE